LEEFYLPADMVEDVSSSSNRLRLNKAMNNYIFLITRQFQAMIPVFSLITYMNDLTAKKQ